MKNYEYKVMLIIYFFLLFLILLKFFKVINYYENFNDSVKRIHMKNYKMISFIPAYDNSKNENKIGYFKVEILQAYSPLYFDHKQKLSCITSAVNLIKILTAESQANLKIYKTIENFFMILKDNDWLKKYVFWELELLKLLGYDLELENLVEKDIVKKQIKIWNYAKIQKLIVKVNNIELLVKKHPSLSINIVTDFILNQAIEVNS